MATSRTGCGRFEDVARLEYWPGRRGVDQQAGHDVRGGRDGERGPKRRRIDLLDGAIEDYSRTIEIERPAAGVQQDKKWLANLERATGHHQVNGRPGVIFTAGTRGKGNTDILSNDVFWA